MAVEVGEGTEVGDDFIEYSQAFAHGSAVVRRESWRQNVRSRLRAARDVYEPVGRRNVLPAARKAG